MAKKFSKEQLVRSKTFSGRADILSALLKEGVQYTVKEVESMVNKFLKKEVR